MIEIGVTGHRFLMEPEKLQAGIAQALLHIDRRFPDPAWSVLSSLAEGADRLVVKQILQYKPQTRFVVPLPLPVEDYLLDFENDESRQEFSRLLDLADEVIQMPLAASPQESYRLAGQYLVDRCQVLVALWDGQEAHGPGGTGEIVAYARRKKLPVAWVRTGNRIPGSEVPVSLGKEQGLVCFEGF